MKGHVFKPTQHVRMLWEHHLRYGCYLWAVICFMCFIMSIFHKTHWEIQWCLDQRCYCWEGSQESILEMRLVVHRLYLSDRDKPQPPAHWDISIISFMAVTLCLCKNIIRYVQPCKIAQMQTQRFISTIAYTPNTCEWWSIIYCSYFRTSISDPNSCWNLLTYKKMVWINPISLSPLDQLPPLHHWPDWAEPVCVHTILSLAIGEGQEGVFHSYENMTSTEVVVACVLNTQLR